MFKYLTLFGNQINLYTTFNNLGNILIFLWVILHLKEYKEFATHSRVLEARAGKKWNGFLHRWVFAFFGAVFIFLLVFLPSGMLGPAISSVFLGTKSDNYFVNIFFVPLELLLYGILFRVSPLKLMDFSTPALIIALICYKAACFCCGCCNGVQCETFGMMNTFTERKEFPIQLVELACAVIMLIIILLIRRKKDRKTGILYPLFILMYCGSRFVSEFWRDDFENVLGPLKGYQIQCIVGFVEGLILLFVVLKFGQRITEYFEAKNQRYFERNKD